MLKLRRKMQEWQKFLLAVQEKGDHVNNLGFWRQRGRDQEKICHEVSSKIREIVIQSNKLGE